MVCARDRRAGNSSKSDRQLEGRRTMRKKTALRTPKQRKTSLHQQGGLIVRGKHPQQSATTKSTLTNRTHRTTIRLQPSPLPCPVSQPNAASNRLRRMMRCAARQASGAALDCTPRSIRRISSLRNTANRRSSRAAAALLLRLEQLLERRVVAQRSEREIDVQPVGVRVPPGERIAEQGHGSVPLAEQRLNPRPPHRVPAE